MRINTTFDKLGASASSAVDERLHRSRLDQVLVSQAKQRIANKGDSQHRYPELWATKTGMGFRAGGSPLRDTGRGMNSLDSRSDRTENGLQIALTTSEIYMLYHQHGFSTSGPNYIPLTKAAARFGSATSAKQAGLKQKVDFLFFPNGVTVPQRKIFNMPPENRRELAAQIKFLLGS